MKLIDAEQCPCYKCGATCPYNHPMDDCKKFSCWILGTVYDVDRVVEELESAIHPYCLYDVEGCDIDEVCLIADMVKDIVRRGGVSD